MFLRGGNKQIVQTDTYISSSHCCCRCSRRSTSSSSWATNNRLDIRNIYRTHPYPRNRVIQKLESEGRIPNVADVPLGEIEENVDDAFQEPKLGMSGETLKP
jgi:hypothetical protein